VDGCLVSGIIREDMAGERKDRCNSCTACDEKYGARLNWAGFVGVAWDGTADGEGIAKLEAMYVGRGAAGWVVFYEEVKGALLGRWGDGSVRAESWEPGTWGGVLSQDGGCVVVLDTQIMGFGGLMAFTYMRLARH
jgi:hypothetical protein